MTQATRAESRSDLQLYNVEEAAAILRVSKRQLYQLVRDRRVPHRKVKGVSVRFSQSDIEQILADSYRPPVES
jgi:excisionase family DNA binding protein